MPSISFQFTLPSRVGHAPAANGWTYHHVLPWRYYWVAGYSLVMLAKYKFHSKNLLTTLKKGSDYHQAFIAEDDAVKGNKRDKNITALFGSDHGGFEVAKSPIALIKLCDDMHGAGQNAATNEVMNSGVVSAEAIAGVCTNPRFGGFAGMSPQQRRDDPHDQYEKRRPHSTSQLWWGQLEILRSILERCTSDLRNPPEDRKLEVSFSQKDGNLLVDTIQTLASSHNFVPAFSAKDWDYCPKGKKLPWHFIHPSHNLSSSSLIGKVFELNTDGNGGTSTYSQTTLGTVPGGEVKVMRSANEPDKLYFC
jgi:hypothetical protein